MSNQIIRNGPPAWLRALREQQAGLDHEEVIESATQFNRTIAPLAELDGMDAGGKKTPAVGSPVLTH